MHGQHSLQCPAYRKYSHATRSTQCGSLHITCSIDLKQFVPDQQVAVDECMIPFRGRLNHKDNRIKWGIKVWMLSDSHTGYNYLFGVYIDLGEHLASLNQVGHVRGLC